MAAASSFSYAQAAKGQGTPTNQSLAPNQDAATENGNHASVADESNEAPTTTPETAKQQSSQGEVRSTPSLDKQEVESVAGPDSETRAESVQEKRAESKRDEGSETSRLDHPWRRNDKGTRSSSATTRSVDDHEPRRSRKGKKGRSAEKTSSDNASAGGDEQKDEPEPPKIELSEAPIPTVNIWQQRKEAQKVKVPEPTSNGVSGHTEQVPDKTAGNAAAAPTQVNGAGKSHHRSSEKPERNGSRGNRMGGRDHREGKTEIPPPVNDVVSWPTPETVIQEDKKKTTDKVERPEKEAPADDSSQKPRQKTEWVTYDYVPSVSFETQLPSMRGSKTRGGSKSAGGSRAPASAQSSDKATAAPPAKPSETRDRPQERSHGAGRTTSLPPGGKRAPADAPHSRGDQRRAGQNGAEKSKEAAASHHQPTSVRI